MDPLAELGGKEVDMLLLSLFSSESGGSGKFLGLS